MAAQDLLKGMDPKGRARMEELLKNSRGGSGGGIFGALISSCCFLHAAPHCSTGCLANSRQSNT